MVDISFRDHVSNHPRFPTDRPTDTKVIRKKYPGTALNPYMRAVSVIPKAIQPANPFCIPVPEPEVRISPWALTLILMHPAFNHRISPFFSLFSFPVT